MMKARDLWHKIGRTAWACADPGFAEVRTEEGKLHLFVAIDRTSKFAFVELHEKATTKVAAEFLRHLIAAVPYKIHTVLTDNGFHFTIPGGGLDCWRDQRGHRKRCALRGSRF